MYIDSHCHITMLEGRAGALERARAAGVSGMLTICTNFASEANDIIELSNNNPDVWCTLGTHPHEADTDCTDYEAFLRRVTQEPKVIGIGETGLDYYYDNSSREGQKQCFSKQIDASLKAKLPLIIHCRDAENDVLCLLKDKGQGAAQGVMHCFSGTPEFAQATLDLGFFISFSGIITFKKADALRTIAASVPLERLLIETDSPYLAPHPHRGRTNEPALIVHTAQCLADLKGICVEDLAKATRENFFALFPKSRSYLS